MGSHRRRRIGCGASGVVLVVVFATTGCGGGAKFKWTDEDAAWSPDGKTIAFDSNRANPGTYRFGLYEMKADGTAVRRLKHAGDGVAYPRFSPDGGRIVYSNSVDDEPGAELVVIDASGGKKRVLTSRMDPAVPAGWSPDGQWIAFLRERSDVDPDTPVDLWVTSSTGRRERRLAKHVDEYNFSTAFAWAPHGRRIAYGCSGGGVCVVGFDGRPQSLTPGGGSKDAAGFLSWSPDGGQVAFVRGTFGPVPGDETDRACVLHLGGAGERSRPLGADASLAWLPGKRPKLVLSGGAGRIFFVRGDGTGKRYLHAVGPASDPYTHDEFASEPTASPDGTKLVFTRYGPVPEGDVPQPQELVVAALPRGRVQAATQVAKR
jgi:dipeptidyl aminopeptidase/acylaminoacyl peptidase